jgi:hypothetical protein
VARITRFLLSCAPGILLLACPAFGQSEVTLEIEAGALTKMPIHVEDFLYENAPVIRFESGESMEDLLVNDLEYSDFFRVSRGPNPGANPGGHRDASVRMGKDPDCRGAAGREDRGQDLRQGLPARQSAAEARDPRFLG